MSDDALLNLRPTNSFDALGDELNIVKMTKALGALSQTWISFRPFRDFAYVVAGCRVDLFDRFDEEALRRERIRRTIYGR